MLEKLRICEILPKDKDANLELASSKKYITFPEENLPQIWGFAVCFAEFCGEVNARRPKEQHHLKHERARSDERSTQRLMDHPPVFTAIL